VNCEIRIHNYCCCCHNGYSNNNNNNNNNNNMLWNQAVHTDREVTANRPDIIIKQKSENMHTDRCGNTGRQKCCAKESEKDVKI
jgi:cytochrome c1